MLSYVMMSLLCYRLSSYCKLLFVMKIRSINMRSMLLFVKFSWLLLSVLPFALSVLPCLSLSLFSSAVLIAIVVVMNTEKVTSSISLFS